MTLKCFKSIQPSQGDSGGPLTYKKRWRLGQGQSQHVLIGVVSGGLGAACDSVTILSYLKT